MERLLSGVLGIASIQEHLFNIDCDEDELFVMFSRCLKSLSNRRRVKLLRWLLLQTRKKCPFRREALGGFAELVLRYSDVQFAEDFRMTRQRFRVCLESYI